MPRAPALSVDAGGRPFGRPFKRLVSILALIRLQPLLVRLAVTGPGSLLLATAGVAVLAVARACRHLSATLVRLTLGFTRLAARLLLLTSLAVRLPLAFAGLATLLLLLAALPIGLALRLAGLAAGLLAAVRVAGGLPIVRTRPHLPAGLAWRHAVVVAEPGPSLIRTASVGNTQAGPPHFGSAERRSAEGGPVETGTSIAEGARHEDPPTVGIDAKTPAQGFADDPSEAYGHAILRHDTIQSRHRLNHVAQGRRRHDRRSRHRQTFYFYHCAPPGL